MSQAHLYPATLATFALFITSAVSAQVQPAAPPQICVNNVCASSPAGGGSGGGGGGGTAAGLKTLAHHWRLSNIFGGMSGNSSLGSIQAEIDQSFAGNPQIAGYRIIFAWAALETSQGNYDFSMIDSIRNYIATKYPTKGFALEIWGEDFWQADPSRSVPGYILNSGTYGAGSDGVRNGYWTLAYGGCTVAWWRPAVMARYIALVQAIAKHVWSGSGNTGGWTYDTDPNFRAIAPIGESAVGVTGGSDISSGAVDTQWQNMIAAAAAAFPHTPVLAADNWGYGGDSDAVIRINAAAAIPGVQISGPDTWPLPTSNFSSGQRAYLGLAAGSANQRANGVPYASVVEYGGAVGSPTSLASIFAGATTGLGAKVIFWEPGADPGTWAEMLTFTAANPL
jgi:hypothetical protein